MRRLALLPLGLAALVAAGLASLALGASHIPLNDVASLLFHPNGSTESLVIQTLRLPRTLVAALAGAGLGVSGLMLQAVTRNPLADPGILGVEAGSALAILVLVVFFPMAPIGWFVPVAFLGGALTALVAYSVARGVGITPLRLALAGVAVASLVGAASRTLQLLWEERAQGALFALSGSVAGRTWEQVEQVAPWLLAGLLAALLLTPRMNVLALGEDVARGLGARTERDAALITGLGVLLAAASVSVVGPVGFVGLIVPHAARALMGPDHRLSLPLCALLGAAFLIAADIAARLIDQPAETPVGILVAAAGAPFFVLLARRIGRR
ncbi:ABC-type Fe3+-siderophore transport system, permease component, FecD (plasmid) [Deinococcus geothermalis DSM 11300]|uniref:ABC-type Fe3+-siderophore transport system, permease component, FecD n=1 Tax=Deinococcus geothermalis (strain DSM 11300 / CIP 105573 / AG-3a) TaxID=319795 RepID=Q1J2U5_DEIGD|nr:iron ABC transporter permease [Deinococcus geothermalis]ABF44189.1 ABC-type Fe3+-siderophore transport system, permease component, FecD [Deinococcus geothermalis DSM 11300]MBI0446800.1 iron ABC transporter permease [Deinococcus sp. DB0503]